MKYATFVILIMCIHVSFAFVNAVGVFPYYMSPHEEWWSNIDQATLEEQSYIKGEVELDYDFGIGDFVKGFFYFIYSFGFGIIVIPYTLSCFGLSYPWFLYLSMPVYLLYFLALAQLLANRATKYMR